MIAAASYLRSSAPDLTDLPPVSVLRPLSGAEDNTEANLRSLFLQRHPEFEVLLAVHDGVDPAAAIARRVMQAFPHIPARLIVAGHSPFPNAKVWSLRALLPEARHEAIVMTDSDIRLAPESLGDDSFGTRSTRRLAGHMPVSRGGRAGLLAAPRGPRSQHGLSRQAC